MSAPKLETGVAELAALAEKADAVGRRLIAARAGLVEVGAQPTVHASRRPFDGGMRMLTVAAVASVFLTLL
ncbi:hypothetical protein [Chthonobacter albigriseus]|uniref:hypothetical protein n=1 Tax=Chthonobacter albigriseus TaxID=1683161 RepID=UPI0015EF10DF|nr:hypothetical protein [Chthonobacter albigriseus]